MNKNLASLSYWFNLRPGELAPNAQKILIIVFFILAGAAIASFVFARIKSGPYVRILKRIYSLSLTNAILTILLWFFAYEMIPFLSARFWFAILGIEILVWLFFIGKDALEIPKRKEEREKEKEYKKYIP